MRTIKFTLALLLIAVFVVFVVQNLTTVDLQFGVWQRQLSLAIPVVGAYFVGGLTARPLLRFLNRTRRERKAARKARRQELKLQAEIAKRNQRLEEAATARQQEA